MTSCPKYNGRTDRLFFKINFQNQKLFGTSKCCLQDSVCSFFHSGTVRSESSNTNGFLVSSSQDSNGSISIDSLNLVRSFCNLISYLLLFSSFIYGEDYQNFVADLVIMADTAAVLFPIVSHSFGPSSGYNTIPIALYFQWKYHVASESQLSR